MARLAKKSKKQVTSKKIEIATESSKKRVKTKATPNPKLKRKHVVVENINTRCFPNHIRDFLDSEEMKGMDETQKAQIESTPFGHFLTIPYLNIERPILDVLVGLWVPERNGFNIGGTIVEFTPIDLALILGLRAKREIVRVDKKCGSYSWAKELEDSRCIISRTTLEKKIRSLIKNHNMKDYDMLKKYFVLYFFCTLLFTNSCYTVSYLWVPFVDDLDNLHNYNWALKVFEYLVESLNNVTVKVKSRNEVDSSMSVGILCGCTIVLNAWLFEHTTVFTPENAHAIPRLWRWERRTYFQRGVILRMLENIKDSQVIKKLHIHQKENYLLPNEDSKSEEPIDYDRRERRYCMTKRQILNEEIGRYRSFSALFLLKQLKKERIEHKRAMRKLKEELAYERGKNKILSARLEGNNKLDTQFKMEDNTTSSSIPKGEVNTLSSILKGADNYFSPPPHLGQHTREGSIGISVKESIVLPYDAEPTKQSSRPITILPCKANILSSMIDLIKRRPRNKSKYASTPYTGLIYRRLKRRKKAKEAENVVHDLTGFEVEADNKLKSQPIIFKDYCGGKQLTTQETHVIDTFLNTPMHLDSQIASHCELCEVNRNQLWALLDGRMTDDDVIDMYAHLLLDREIQEDNEFTYHRTLYVSPQFMVNDAFLVSLSFHYVLCSYYLLLNHNFFPFISLFYFFLMKHYYNSFFDKYCWKFVAHLTKEALIGASLILLPICESKHWMLLYCDVEEKKFGLLNPLRRHTRNRVVKELIKWLRRYLMETANIDANEWEENLYLDCLQQAASSLDCGIFVMKYMDYLHRGCELQFSAKDVNYLRGLIAFEILDNHIKKV